MGEPAVATAEKVTVVMAKNNFVANVERKSKLFIMGLMVTNSEADLVALEEMKMCFL